MADAEVYVSFDVEADGPVPGPFSMLALGACVAGRRTVDGRWRPEDVDAGGFYCELAPIGDRALPEALEVSGLDREALAATGTSAPVAMRAFTGWLEQEAEGARPVMCSYPAAFDWSFLWWYLTIHGPDQLPLEFSSSLDMRTLYAAKSGALWAQSGRRSLPAELRSSRLHTHNALDDAREQAEVLSKLLLWTPCA